MSDSVGQPLRPGAAHWLRRWHLPVALIAALFLLEGTVRIIDPIRRFIHPHTNDYDLAMWDVYSRPAAAGQPAAFIFGSSVAREGFDGQWISQHCGVQTWNVALTSVQVHEFENMGLPLSPDSTLVFAVNALMFDDRQRSDPAMPWNRDERVPWIIGRRDELSALLLHRTRRLARIALGREADPVTEGKARRQYRYDGRLPENELAEMKRAMLARYVEDRRQHDERNLASFGELCERAEQGAFHMEVVWLPLADAELDRRFADVRARVMEIAHKHGIAVHDFTSLGLSDQDFHDYGHVLASGRKRYSEELARILRRGA